MYIWSINLWFVGVGSVIICFVFLCSVHIFMVQMLFRLTIPMLRLLSSKVQESNNL